MTDPSLRKRVVTQLDVPLRVRARQLAFGHAAGNHRAARKGAGVEFAGHRPYTPGDDLRHLDRHALLRHGRLLIREFDTDTERAVHVIVDVSTSMDYRGSIDEESKAQRALLLAAALLAAARAGGDSVGVSVVGESSCETQLPRSKREDFERALSQLERAESSLRSDAKPAPSARREAPQSREASNATRENWLKTLRNLGGSLPRGTVVFVISDYLDLDAELERDLVSLGTRGRVVRGLQILSHDEIDFPFEGALVLRDPETGLETETDATAVRSEYLSHLDALTASLGTQWRAQGGMWLRHDTSETPAPVFRQAAAGTNL
jgi:uncharacterized protein (DUF58 family)